MGSEVALCEQTSVENPRGGEDGGVCACHDSTIREKDVVRHLTSQGIWVQMDTCRKVKRMPAKITPLHTPDEV